MTLSKCGEEGCYCSMHKFGYAYGYPLIPLCQVGAILSRFYKKEERRGK